MINLEEGQGRLVLGINPLGMMSVRVHSGGQNVHIGDNEDGGRILILGKNGKSVILSFDKYGGYIKTAGKAIMGINKYGNGAVSTCDKNGYQQ